MFIYVIVNIFDFSDYFKDILDAFDVETAQHLILDDVHMNNQGYLFLAEQVAAFLIQEGIVARQ